MSGYYGSSGKIIYDVGINDIGVSLNKIDNGKRAYTVWESMLSRCYSDKFIKKNPTYINCQVEESFKSFKSFYEFVSKMKGFNSIDSSGSFYQLDKDLLKRGNKLYSRDNICFVPSEINNFLLNCSVARGRYPIGVCLHTDGIRFRSQIKSMGKKRHIGLFDNEHDAFVAYKIEKEKYAKYLADKWFESIDYKAYEALIRFVVDIND
ncbi:MAG: hypothetical protein GAK29_01429 [Acinetobacter bereziniae]|uniref:Uncharacterized protein n=1 Tax=Acinetobacter bereziniae TaxID=106648 RepID=A0A833PGN5_ACIBZ|nr:MAG: hypothetical protein GAK29_01429 [Acinetobacter bereziniae]